jgi:hypothetical protein
MMAPGWRYCWTSAVSRLRRLPEMMIRDTSETMPTVNDPRNQSHAAAFPPLPPVVLAFSPMRQFQLADQRTTKTLAIVSTAKPKISAGVLPTVNVDGRPGSCIINTG